MRTLSWLSYFVVAGALFCAVALFGGTNLQAQSSRATPRIATEVNESHLATLKGNVPSLSRAEYDQGEATPSTQLSHVQLVLSRSSEQQAALDQYLAGLQDKSSSNYHKWLTPEQFGQLYGPADSDIAALEAWLQSHGFKVETVSLGRTNIAFSGSVSQIEEAFHTSIHSFQTDDAQFYSNTTDPQIPSALAGVVMGVAHLNTIRPRAHSVHGSMGRTNQQTGRAESNSTPLAGPSPALTGSGNLFIVPADAATIYDTPNSYNINFAGGASYTGSGVKIGIGGDAVISASIVGAYRSTFLGVSTLPIINYCESSGSCSTSNLPSTSNAGDAVEAYIDTELSGGLAPGATVYYYYADDLNVAIEGALNANVVSIFSLSFGECEANMGTSGNTQLNKYWEQAAAEGIAVTVSSGDSGSASCDGDTAKTTTRAKLGLSVSGYASTPYNIAVGGTDFYGLENAFSTYVSNTAGRFYETAKGYIPESIWNDSTTSDTQPLIDNVAETGRYASIVAGSGGVSTVYGLPSWQMGNGIPATVPSGVSANARSLPDVSIMSGNGYDYATWLICDASYPCTSISSGDYDLYGGTSTAAPAFAGILAIVEQKTGSRLGQAAQELYALYNGSNAGSVFHDVTMGNNSVYCVSGSPNCEAVSPNNYFETGYNALTGYDLASGLGSVDATKLVNYWSSSIGSAAATVNVNPTPNPVTTAESLTVNISVTGNSVTPTGTVTLTSGSYNSGAQTLGEGGCLAASCTITVPAGDLAIGTDTLTVTYSGNATYATTTNSSQTVTVTGTASSSTFVLTATPTTITSLTPGDTSSVTVAATTTNGYAGTVVVTCTLTASPSGANSGYLPTCSGPVPTTPLFMGGAGSKFTISTTATSAALFYPKLPGKGRGSYNLFGAGGGATLALLFFLGIPARRRSWRSMLGVLVLMTALGGLAACGGGGGGGGSSTASIPGTSVGTYTFTITGVGSDTSKTTETTTFTVTVN